MVFIMQDMVKNIAPNKMCGELCDNNELKSYTWHDPSCVWKQQVWGVIGGI